jgi:CheY-specific phosphatase CheX
MTTLQGDIIEIARSILESMFDLPLDEAATPTLDLRSTVTGCVHIDGAWNGAVILQCPMVLATRLTVEMFQGPSSPEAEEVRDAIGELTNMLAGNVKGLLPEPCRISLPAVALGSDYRFSVVGTVTVASVPFSCAGHPLVVTLLQRVADQPADA